MNFRYKLVAGIGMAAAIFALIGILSYRSLDRTQEDFRWVAHTYIVLEHLDELRATIFNATTSQRSFLLTGDESLLDTYNNSLSPIQQNLAELRQLTSDNPTQQTNIDRLAPLVHATLAKLQDRVEIRRYHGLQASIDAIQQVSGQASLDLVSHAIADMERVEHTLLVQRQANVDATANRVRIALLLGDTCALLFLILSGAVINQEMARRRRADTAVRDLNAQLELRVAARTAELAERAKDLARSNAELQQFAYVASHDLQEPLRMVASFTQLLAKRYSDKLDDDAREFIHFAVDGANRLQILITDLLAFSRVGTRAKPLERVESDWVLDRVLHSLKLATSDSGAQITRDPLPAVMADPVQLGQLFQNLLTNAMKFRRPGTPPRIHISAEPSGSLWKIRVRDNGIGIAAEHSDRIFAIFQRLHTKAEYPGTGIGLAICKKIVERHGGAIGIEPSPGGGTTFCFTLPVIEENARVEKKQDEHRAAVASR